jgi:hypothetical protein
MIPLPKSMHCFVLLHEVIFDAHSVQFSMPW